MTEELLLEPLIPALMWYDDRSRLTRAKRIEWASSLYFPEGIMEGELVQLSLMEEARFSFVNGQFLATVICSASALEHLLVVKLKEIEVSLSKPTLGALIQKADDKKLLPSRVIDCLRELNELRNPIVHRRDPKDQSTLVSRYLQKKIHPNALKEDDARFALKVMYLVFLLLLEQGRNVPVVAE